MILKQKKYNPLNNTIKFSPEDQEINKFLQSIKIYGVLIKSVHNTFDSKINFNENLVISWLNKKNFISELLFRKTRDGSTLKDFHKKCDNKGTTIIFIETVKGFKFGGYTELEWDKKSGYKEDNSTFIFSFDNKKKYTRINNYNEPSINCTYDESPWFGCLNADIKFNGTLNKGQSANYNITSFSSGTRLTNGEMFYDVKELEVHKIIYLLKK